MDTRKFQILNPKDDSNVLGGDVGIDNAYIRAYPRYLEKHAQDLEVGESTMARYSLSGTVGVYRVVRVA